MFVVLSCSQEPLSDLTSVHINGAWQNTNKVAYYSVTNYDNRVKTCNFSLDIKLESIFSQNIGFVSMQRPDEVIYPGQTIDLSFNFKPFIWELERSTNDTLKVVEVDNRLTNKCTFGNITKGLKNNPAVYVSKSGIMQWDNNVKKAFVFLQNYLSNTIECNLGVYVKATGVYTDTQIFFERQRKPDLLYPQQIQKITIDFLKDYQKSARQFGDEFRLDSFIPDLLIGKCEAAKSYGRGGSEIHKKSSRRNSKAYKLNSKISKALKERF